MSNVVDASKKKHRARNWVLGALAAFATIGVISSLSGGGSGSTPSSANSGGSADVDEAAPKLAGPGDQAGLGDQTRDGDFTFVVQKMTEAQSVGDQYLGKEAEGKFILIDLTVTNHGDEAQTMFGNNQVIHDKAGKKYSTDTGAAVYLGKNGSIYEEINPGNTLKGVLVFDIPKDVKPTSIELHDSSLSDGVTVSLT